jgi:hypothetical protein
MCLFQVDEVDEGLIQPRNCRNTPITVRLEEMHHEHHPGYLLKRWDNESDGVGLFLSKVMLKRV